MITRLIWTPMSSVPKKADKLNLSLSSFQLKQYLDYVHGGVVAVVGVNLSEKIQGAVST